MAFQECGDCMDDKITALKGGHCLYSTAKPEHGLSVALALHRALVPFVTDVGFHGRIVYVDLQIPVDDQMISAGLGSVHMPHRGHDPETST